MNLWRDHPNFAIALTFTAIFNLGCGLIGVLDPEAMAVPALFRTLDLLTAEQWGVLHLLIGGLILAGALLDNFQVTRVGLAIGCTVAVLRCGLLMASAWIDDVPTGFGIPVWFLVLGQHLSMVREPPVNPATQR
jgi:ABC-type uncharacterized transport system permease subunit